MVTSSTIDRRPKLISRSSCAWGRVAIEGRDPGSDSQEDNEDEKIQHDDNAEDLGAEAIAQVSLLHENGVQPGGIQQIEEGDGNGGHRHETVILRRENANDVKGDGPRDELSEKLRHGCPAKGDEDPGPNIHIVAGSGAGLDVN